MSYRGDESDDESDGGDREEYDALRLSWACLVVGCAKLVEAARRTVETGELQSFRVVARQIIERHIISPLPEAF